MCYKICSAVICRSFSLAVEAFEILMKKWIWAAGDSIVCLREVELQGFNYQWITYMLKYYSPNRTSVLFEEKVCLTSWRLLGVKAQGQNPRQRTQMREYYPIIIGFVEFQHTYSTLWAKCVEDSFILKHPHSVVEMIWHDLPFTSINLPFGCVFVLQVHDDEMQIHLINFVN